jgi:hypothetical protein
LVFLLSNGLHASQLMISWFGVFTEDLAFFLL